MGADQALGAAGEDQGRYVVALSDVHLGTDGPTVWYQRSVHEPLLAHLLDWIAAQAEHVREVVLLGDIVDLWTYPAEEQPPTFADIVATHPAILGPTGKLAAVLDAVDGAVTYVPGNHDLGVTAEEVATLRSPGGHHVRLADTEPHFPLGADDTRLALTHGHDFTLFNAPHLRNPWAPLPVGYFVTRAVATAWSRRLADGTTVADLAGQGAPNGIDLGSLRSVAAGLRAWSITASVVDFVVGATGVDPTEPILMPDGSTATLAEAKVAYADCWTDWAADHGGGLVGAASAGRAALADLDGSYLGWFAQQLAFAADTELVVMGHTHVPIAGLDGSPIRYANTGFDCPSGPDMARTDAPQRATFAVIDTHELTATIWEVAAGDDGDRVCRETVAGRARVVGGQGMDFSCYVTVDNTAGSEPLRLVASTAPYGGHPTPPPDEVPAGRVARFWIQDQFGPSGSEGSATYEVGDRQVQLRYTCPTLGGNAAGATVVPVARDEDAPDEGAGGAEGADGGLTVGVASRVGDGPWIEGSVVRRGHPLQVRFTVRD